MWALTQDAFDKLLAWLSPDRERAGERYGEIYSNLIKGFERHGCQVPEELADETINRVAKKLPEIESQYVGDPARYFYGVAHNVHREHLRKELRTVPLTQDDAPDVKVMPFDPLEDVEPEYTCLERCMQHLTPGNREMILQYHRGEKQVKIKLRKELAQKLGIDIPLLRLRARHIRVKLKKCIMECLAGKAPAESY